MKESRVIPGNCFFNYRWIYLCYSPLIQIKKMLENVCTYACMAVGSSSVQTPQQQSHILTTFKYMYYVRDMGLKINPYFGQNKLKIGF